MTDIVSACKTEQRSQIKVYLCKSVYALCLPRDRWRSRCERGVFAGPWQLKLEEKLLFIIFNYLAIDSNSLGVCKTDWKFEQLPLIR